MMQHIYSLFVFLLWASVTAPTSVSAQCAGQVSQFPAGNVGICPGATIVLTAAPTAGFSFSWYRNGVAIAGANGGSLIVSQPGDYAVVGTDATGCQDTSAITTVVLFPAPIAQLSSNGIPVGCAGDSLLLFATGGLNYEWFYFGQSQAVTDPFLFARTPGNYSVAAVDSNGCRDTSSIISYSWFPPLLADIAGPTPAEVCPNEPVDLQALIAGPFAGVNWFRNDTLISGQTNLSLNTDEPALYTVTAFDTNGCRVTSEPFLLLNANPPSATLVETGPEPLCEGDSLVLIGRGGSSYIWRIDGVDSGTTDSTLVIRNSAEVELVAINGCGRDSLTLDVNVIRGPEADFSYNNLTNQEVELIDASIDGALWQWSVSGSPLTSNEQNPTLVFPTNGPFSVQLIVEDQFGCRDTISNEIFVRDPANMVSNVFSPNGDDINDELQTNFDDLQQFTFAIYDRWGRQVFKTGSPTEFWNGRVGGSEAVEGAYYYHVVGLDRLGREVEEKGNISLLR